MKYLGLLDVAGIQRYITQHDRLVHIAGASNRVSDLGAEFSGFFEAGQGVEKIVSAAGNAAFTSTSQEKLKEVIRRCSRHILENHPGLEIRAVIFPYEEGQLAERYGEALHKLELRKATQPESATFVFTGEQEEKKRPKSRSVNRDGIWEPRDFSDMICAGPEESHLMAVVSVDGLNMGGKFGQWLEQSTGLNDDEFRNQFSLWSKAVEDHWKDAWERTGVIAEKAFIPSSQLENAPDEAREAASGRVLQHAVNPDRWIALNRTKSESGRAAKTYFPFRRIYQGGDDMSFVCDARIAIAMTSLFLHELEKPVEGLKKLDGEPDDKPESPFSRLTLSAGIVFVHYTFPYLRARELADEVRQAAKKRAMELHEKGTPPPSAIIWWLNRQGSMDMPGAEEDKKFTPTPSIKPYLLKPLDSDNGNRWHQNWQWMEEIVLGTVESEAGLWKKFGDSRNKMKDLVAAAEEDEDGAGIDRLFRLRPMEGDLNPLKWLKAEMRTHYMDNHLCAALLDAAELYDIHFPIKSGGATHETVA